jgi:predicted membrane-bound mannosyltransferase
MENMFRKAGKTGRILLVIIIIAAGWKAILLSLNSFPFNSDEAIVALMARHILAGERPVFFYGQAYMGSLDAYLVAAGFASFGQSVWVIRLVQSVLYLFTIITTFAVGILIFQSELVGLIATVLIAIPTVNVTLYTTVSLGGYGEAILLGNLIILTGFGILRNSEQLYHKRVYKDPFVWFALLWGVFSAILGQWPDTCLYCPGWRFYLVEIHQEDWCHISSSGRGCRYFLAGRFPDWYCSNHFTHSQ